mgnify:FL=1
MALNFANNNSLSSITAKPSGLAGGGLNLISTQTASSSANLSFTSGIDSTYKEYVFKFINIHPATNGSHFTFQGSTDGGSNYGVTITSTAFSTEHNEADTSTDLSYQTAVDLAQSTNFQRITSSNSNNNDDNAVGFLHLFDPSNTTFVKHFIINGNTVASAYTVGTFIAGYFNSTNDIDAIQFKMSSGNIDSGVIKLYGVS